MSYILEALKKSEITRQQGAGALQCSLLPVITEEDIARRRVWPYLLVAGLVLNAAVLYLWSRPTVSGEVVAKSQTVSNAEPTAAQSAVAAAGQTHPAASALQTTPNVEAAPLPSRPEIAGNLALDAQAASPEKLRARDSSSDVAQQAKLPAIAATLPGKAPEPMAVSGTQEPKPAAVKDPPRRARTVEADAAPMALSEPNAKVAVTRGAKPSPADSAEVRKNAGESPSVRPIELPSITIGGFIREDGSSGMAMVNDRLVREGDEVMPGLRVEKIHNESVVFNYKGQRFVR